MIQSLNKFSRAWGVVAFDRPVLLVQNERGSYVIDCISEAVASNKHNLIELVEPYVSACLP